VFACANAGHLKANEVQSEVNAKIIKYVSLE